MVTLLDIVRRAQGGSATDNLARQFGLSGDQARQAIEAFLPAFSLGLQRSAASPSAFGQILEMVSSGRYAPFYDAATRGLPHAADGQQVLERLFGSPEISRQIAVQASAMTGIGAQVLERMMPALAGLVMGGLFRMASVEGLSDFLRGWSDWLRSLKPAEAASVPAFGTGSPFALWTDLMGAMMGGTPSAQPDARTSDPWTAFLTSLAGEAAPKPPPPPPSQPDPFAALSQMFETGREVQAQHLANLQAIFDGFRPAGSRR